MVAHFCSPKAGCDEKAKEDYGSLLVNLAHMVNPRISERPHLKKTRLEVVEEERHLIGSLAYYTNVCAHTGIHSKKIYQVLWEF